MTEQISGKLELLFAHLSINNVRDIKPLLMDAIDEYQSIRSYLTYDQKQTVNLIKSLLYHAEREEWHQARNQLNGAQKAYQEYMNNRIKIKGYGQKLGYAQIHGKQKVIRECSQLALPWNEGSQERYLLNDKDIRQSEKTETDSSKSSALKENALSNTFKSPVLIQHAERKAQTPDDDEQGPDKKTSFLNESVTRLNSYDYPGSYSKQMQENPQCFKHTPETNTERKYNDNENNADPYRFDPNRPSRIVESYQSLFDNEWQQALKAIKREAVIEETAIECLLYILVEAYKECLDEAQVQILQFEHAVLNIVSDGKYTKFDKDVFNKTGNRKHMLQYRKEISDLSVKRLQDTFLLKTLPVIHRRYGVKKGDSVDNYSRQCIVLTWRMAIQDPPLHFDIFDPSTKVEFDHNLYRPFSKSGYHIRSLIWPVLRLYMGGPVLCKGIADG